MSGDGAGNGSLSEPRDRVGPPVSAEQTYRRLRERERDLEVERIAADVALESAALGARVELTPEEADRIREALDLRHSLADELAAAAGPRAAAPEVVMRRLAAGAQALRDWVGPPGDPASLAPHARARGILTVATVAALILAFTVHLAFLVLLVPLSAVSGFLWSGQDSAWRRAGARRQFEATGLAAPAAWETGRVEARLAQIEEAMARTARPAAEEKPARRDRGAIEGELADAQTALAEALAAAGISAAALDQPLERRLRLMSRSYQAARELGRINAELARLRLEIDEERGGCR